MIKPCLGYSPEHGAKLFYESALGGGDLIKDDELFGSTSISDAAGRLKAYRSAARAVMEKTGKEPVYIANITDTPKRMRDHAKLAVDEGAKAVMVNFVATGIDAFRELTEEFGSELCFLAHYA
ncbi:MAG TPA: transcriptional regulator, partial [Ruminiclostridium sp.]|nr:transcriptional regulator [Ruminiclostridium sp.]